MYHLAMSLLKQHVSPRYEFIKATCIVSLQIYLSNVHCLVTTLFKPHVLPCYNFI